MKHVYVMEAKSLKNPGRWTAWSTLQRPVFWKSTDLAFFKRMGITGIRVTKYAMKPLSRKTKNL